MGASYSMAEAVRAVFDKWPVGHEFYGTELKAGVVRMCPKARHMYHESLLRRLRESRHPHFVCIDVQRSLYRKVSKYKG